MRKQLKKTKITNQPKKQKRMIKTTLFWGAIIISLLFLSQLKTHQVSGNSMLPVLKDKDRIAVFRGNEPQRLQLITFEPIGSPGTSFIKRVIGIPGDRIHIEGRQLFITTEPSRRQEEGKHSESIESPVIVEIKDPVYLQLKELDKIPANQYFVLGDNRNYSKDSRSLGLIDKRQIEGVVVFRYFPLNSFGPVK